jgi:hypothetical protein
MHTRLPRTLVGQDAPPDSPPEDPSDDEDATPLEFNDDPWEVFLPDDDQADPVPEPGDFWVEGAS